MSEFQKPNEAETTEEAGKQTAWDYFLRMEEVLGTNFALLTPEPALGLLDGPYTPNPQDN